MKIRAKANGVVYDYPEEQAEALLKTGIYEDVDVEDDDAVKPKKATYKRRDMKAEE